MRENKYDTLLKFSIAILCISALMLLFAGYNIFIKAGGKKTVDQSAYVRDSLQQVYSSTLQNLNTGIQLAGNIGSNKEGRDRISEMNILRNEIDSLLKQHGSEADLITAKAKIESLQGKVAELQTSFSDIAAENRRLQALINSFLTGDKKQSANEKVPETTKLNLKANSISSDNATVSAMHLFAVADKNSKDRETATAEEAEKIVGSFFLKNIPSKATGEVVVVVLQPDGKVVKNSVWETGTFETNEGKKVYSRKIYFDPSGEGRQLNFSLTPDRFLPGDYTMQIWYNGNLLARMVRTLS